MLSRIAHKLITITRVWRTAAGRQERRSHLQPGRFRIIQLVGLVLLPGSAVAVQLMRMQVAIDDTVQECGMRGAIDTWNYKNKNFSG